MTPRKAASEGGRGGGEGNIASDAIAAVLNRPQRSRCLKKCKVEGKMQGELQGVRSGLQQFCKREGQRCEAHLECEAILELPPGHSGAGSAATMNPLPLLGKPAVLGRLNTKASLESDSSLALLCPRPGPPAGTVQA